MYLCIYLSLFERLKTGHIRADRGSSTYVFSRFSKTSHHPNEPSFIKNQHHPNEPSFIDFFHVTTALEPSHLT